MYRATDTKLKRQVAIKILPPSLAADHDRLARFQREAEVLASLNHPHIAAIYGLEESAGITALVMELVEGDDLWHFDPRWVLGDERYQGHGTVPHLRSTNIPGYDQTMSGVAFDPSLGRASYVVRRSGESVSVRRFNAHTLAAAAKRRRATHVRPRGAAAVGWQLRAFWRFS